MSDEKKMNVMTKKEVGEYLKEISKFKVDLQGMEGEVAQKFRDVGERIGLISDQMGKLKAEFDKASYQMNVYSTLLIEEENKRRVKAHEDTSKLETDVKVINPNIRIHYG